jgi:hypothetical protein
VRGEARQNLIAIVVGLGLVAAFIAFCARPAVALPVGATTLENSIGVLSGDAGHLDHPERADARCRDLGDGDFKCWLATFSIADFGVSAGSPRWSLYEVVVDGSGCWVVSEPDRSRSKGDGCINLTDYFGY